MSVDLAANIHAQGVGRSRKVLGGKVATYLVQFPLPLGSTPTRSHLTVPKLLSPPGPPLSPPPPPPPFPASLNGCYEVQQCTHQNFAFYAFSFDQLTCLRLPLSLLLNSKKVMERGTNVRGHATRPLLDEERTENFCNRDDGSGSGSSCSDASSFTIVLVFSVAVVFCGSFTLGCAVSTISCP
ncbi:hypothetical protein CK203_084979 [Vitis vinifera]|uniref:Uncharacterized protein n=1 Tax=Vitis vinifera TaxID=29760 RepID=A0A438F068_VITVI|nr:hypothetical protein CK203_084979 [Vitis vinifera]